MFANIVANSSLVSILFAFILLFEPVIISFSTNVAIYPIAHLGIVSRLEGVILTYKEDLNLSKDESINKLAQKFSLSKEIATKYVDRYYN